MEKRRSAVWLAAALGLSALPASPCTPALEGARVESPRYALAFRAPQIAVGAHFSLEIAACAKPGAPPPETLKVDAHMPAHRHGMNYVPTVTRLADDRWRADGLMFHMPGKWEFVFTVNGERMTHALVAAGEVHFSDDEFAAILRHGPWPPPAPRDPSNRVSGRRAAIAFGERLFFEPRLSGTGSVLCATCHAPFRQFQDGRPRAFGLGEVDRNTPSLVNVAFYRWYGWDGGHDSLWSQSIRPLLDAREMRASPGQVARIVRTLFPKDYEGAFGRPPPRDDEQLLVDAGKALAAFQESLVSARSAFDDFRDALARDDPGALRRYPPEAQRGLKIFVGRGNCNVCHFGPLFTNGEFADIGIAFFAAPGRVDPGRHGGIARLKASPYNLLGRFSDDHARTSATGTRHVEAQHRNFGEFRVPGLRNVALTAPYMHDGSLATLDEVVRHYSELNEERLHADGERILRPLGLSEDERSDLVKFLKTL
jgi:cytochrome c peroxidase